MKTRLEHMLTSELAIERPAKSAAQVIRILRREVRRLAAENFRLKAKAFFS
jgi:hypothetical protein